MSAVAFGWVVVQAQGGCEAESPEPAASKPEAAPAQQAEVEPAAEPPPPTPKQPPAIPASETPTAKPADAADAKKPDAFFPPSKSGAFEFDAADSAGAGVGGIRPSQPSDKSNNAGTKPKPKAFFPASKSGRVREPMQQAPNAPATK